MNAAYPTLESPYRVTAPDGKLHLIIMNATDGLPAAFALMGTRAEQKVAIRISGGCKGMNAADKIEMLDYFAQAFQGYRGLVWSGGSRAIDKEGQVDPMVTDIPGVIAQANPGSVALATVPRTDVLSLQGDSRLVLDEWNVPNPSVSGILIVQNGADGAAADIGQNGGWDLDVPTAFNLMENWKKYAKFAALGFIGWNGGPITEDEIIRASKNGYITVVVSGSGRVADEFAAGIASGDGTCGGKIKKDSVLVVPRADPQALRQVLVSANFFPQAAAA